MKAIPTMYHGRQYRSRLEARWAAFFDVLGWRTEYEPVDFDGWIPDFVISEAETVYVEVKPVDAFPSDVAAEIDRSGCDKEVLIVGMTVPIQGNLIGWLREDIGTLSGSHVPQWDWGGAALGIWTGTETQKAPGRIPLGNRDLIVGFCHETQGYSDRITGFYDGGCYGAIPFNIHDAGEKWAAASNKVQWKSPA